MKIHLHPQNKIRARRILWCRTCRCRRRVVMSFSAWLGARFCCCGCGEDPRVRPKRFRRITDSRLLKIARAQAWWLMALNYDDALARLMDELARADDVKE